MNRSRDTLKRAAVNSCLLHSLAYMHAQIKLGTCFYRLADSLGLDVDLFIIYEDTLCNQSPLI